MPDYYLKDFKCPVPPKKSLCAHLWPPKTLTNGDLIWDHICAALGAPHPQINQLYSIRTDISAVLQSLLWPFCQIQFSKIFMFVLRLFPEGEWHDKRAWAAAVNVVSMFVGRAKEMKPMHWKISAKKWENVEPGVVAGVFSCAGVCGSLSEESF